MTPRSTHRPKSTSKKKARHSRKNSRLRVSAPLLPTGTEAPAARHKTPIFINNFAKWLLNGR